VDWCDAFAYCAWAGKRLCGRIGSGETPYDDFKDAAVSEWFNACSAGGTLIDYPFPWYDSPDSYTTCNIYFDVNVQEDGWPVGRRKTLPVAIKSSCRGPEPYDAIYDLLGNVAEWENSCGAEIGLDDPCRYRGGNFASTLDCSDGTRAPRYETNRYIGFRCCADVSRR
jgi:formylglycine-generating enzyme required for sulfatase activity